MKKYIIALLCALHVPLFAMEARDVAELIKNHKLPVCNPGKVICSRMNDAAPINVDFAAAITSNNAQQVQCQASLCPTEEEKQTAALLAVKTNRINSLKALFQSGVKLNEITQIRALSDFYALLMNAEEGAHWLEPLFNELNTAHPLLLTHWGAEQSCLPIRKIKERIEKYNKEGNCCCKRFLPYEAAKVALLCRDLRNTAAFFNVILTLHAQQMAEQARKKQEAEQAQ